MLQTALLRRPGPQKSRRRQPSFQNWTRPFRSHLNKRQRLRRRRLRSRQNRSLSRQSQNRQNLNRQNPNRQNHVPLSRRRHSQNRQSRRRLPRNRLMSTAGVIGSRRKLQPVLRSVKRHEPARAAVRRNPVLLRRPASIPGRKPLRPVHRKEKRPARYAEQRKAFRPWVIIGCITRRRATGRRLSPVTVEPSSIPSMHGWRTQRQALIWITPMSTLDTKHMRFGPSTSLPKTSVPAAARPSNPTNHNLISSEQ